MRWILEHESGCITFGIIILYFLVVWLCDRWRSKPDNQDYWSSL